MNRRSSVSSSSSAPASSALVKRPAVENAAKVAAAASEQAKKRVALGNITNKSNAGWSASRLPGTKGVNVGKIAVRSFVFSFFFYGVVGSEDCCHE